jgi:hypothetical protein
MVQKLNVTLRGVEFGEVGGSLTDGGVGGFSLWRSPNRHYRQLCPLRRSASAPALMSAISAHPDITAKRPERTYFFLGTLSARPWVE